LGNPAESRGNKHLLEQFQFQNAVTKEVREKAVPIIFFKSLTVDGRGEGNRIIQGLGLICSVERITQYQKDIGYFTNYIFEFSVFDMTEEFELFFWDWISSHRDSSKSSRDVLSLSPYAWLEWVKEGNLAIGRVIRHVSRFSMMSKGH
jgi:hypothetical protein